MNNSRPDPYKLWKFWSSLRLAGWLRYLYMLGYARITLDEVEFIEEMFLAFARDEERGWQVRCRKDFPYDEREWLNVFPEMKAVIPLKVQEWVAHEAALRTVIKNKIKNFKCVPRTDAERIFFKEWLMVCEGREILSARKHIKRLRYLMAKKASKQGIEAPDIEAAKAVPIENILPNSDFLRSGNNLRTLCPIHSERTPSFYVYNDTNTFHCFGCGRGRSSIDLVMALYGCGFIEAVKKLIFYSGKKVEKK